MAQHHHPHSVLLVDDHEDTRQMSLIVLRSQGFQASAVPGGDAAFDVACSERPDVIVTDLAMPEGDGWQLLQRLSSDDRTKDIPVVMVTACATESVRERARQEPLAGFFFTPCPPDVLAAELRRVIAERSVPALRP
jgi:CheY-like chemotaxis protein